MASSIFITSQIRILPQQHSEIYQNENYGQALELSCFPQNFASRLKKCLTGVCEADLNLNLGVPR